MRGRADSAYAERGIVHKRLLVPTLTAFLMLGGVSYARNGHPVTNPAKIELCVQAKTDELVTPGASGCRPGDRPVFLAKRGPRGRRGRRGARGAAGQKGSSRSRWGRRRRRVDRSNRRDGADGNDWTDWSRRAGWCDGRNWCDRSDRRDGHADHPNAIGGGLAAAPNSVFLFFSQPIGGSPTSPATGWQASGNVNAGFNATITVYAICST